MPAVGNPNWNYVSPRVREMQNLGSTKWLRLPTRCSCLNRLTSLNGKNGLNGFGGLNAFAKPRDLQRSLRRPQVNTPVYCMVDIVNDIHRSFEQTGEYSKKYEAVQH